MPSVQERQALRRAKRLIIKIGSKALSVAARDPERTLFRSLATDIAALIASGKRVVLVSSGAIALGLPKLGLSSRPRDMPRLQAAAAAGQSLLMQSYESAFAEAGVAVAQILLTHADLANRTRANNAREALRALLEASVVPIINENDVVAVDEIRFGDNDQLAAMTVPLCGADLLILLSDVEGLLRPDGRRIGLVRALDAKVEAMVTSEKSDVGTGGMQSKLEAVHRATLAGCPVVIARAARPSVITSIVSGAGVGTLFLPAPHKLSARKHWIAFTLRPKGGVVLDAGAARAVQTGKKSVLAVGVLGVRGVFAPGDPVSLYDPAGEEIGRGLSRMSSLDAAVLASAKSPHRDAAIVIHKDDLVAGVPMVGNFATSSAS